MIDSIEWKGHALYLRKMPYSEVCMSMRIGGMLIYLENVGNHMVQLWSDGEKFSAPITWGEAGITPQDPLAIRWEESDAATSEVRARG